MGLFMSDHDELERQAREGDAEAMFQLGVLAEQASDIEFARFWYEKAAQLGITDAMYQLGLFAHDEHDTVGVRNCAVRPSASNDN